MPSCVSLSSLSFSGTARPRLEGVRRGTLYVCLLNSQRQMRRSDEFRSPASQRLRCHLTPMRNGHSPLVGAPSGEAGRIGHRLQTGLPELLHSERTKHGLQDGTLLSIWGVALRCICVGCSRPWKYAAGAPL